jgi:hypothetical protein
MATTKEELADAHVAAFREDRLRTKLFNRYRGAIDITDAMIAAIEAGLAEQAAS